MRGGFVSESGSGPDIAREHGVHDPFEEATVLGTTQSGPASVWPLHSPCLTGFVLPQVILERFLTGLTLPHAIP
jgi:hypothetical protein